MKYFCKVTNASHSQAKVNTLNNDILFFYGLNISLTYIESSPVREWQLTTSISLICRLLFLLKRFLFAKN